MDFGKVHNTFVIDDFKGFTAESWSPPGSIVDLGEWHTPVRARGFQIDSSGKVVKSGGYSVVTQLFGHTDLSQVHGMHYWRAGGSGSNLILAGTFGLLHSYQSGTPYQMLFREIEEPDTWISQPSADPGTNEGPGHLLGCFCEYRDRLYYCNGLDWPIRIDGLGSLHENDGTPTCQAMGAPVPDISSYITVRRSLYEGRHVDDYESTYGTQASYYATIVSKFGESRAKYIPVPFSTGLGTYPLFTISWLPDLNGLPYATAVRLYRVPVAGITPQLVVEIPVNSTSFLDDVPDSELGVGLPYDLGDPSRFRLLAAHDERLFAVGGFSNENRLSCSKAGFPDQWPAIFEIPLSSSLGQRRIAHIKVVNGSFYIFLDYGILSLVGNSPENYNPRIINNFVGCVAPRTLVPWQDGVVFLSRDGLYLFNGSTLQNLSAQLTSLLDSSTLGSRGLSWACGAISHEYYYLSYRDDSERHWDPSASPVAGIEPNRTLVVNMTNGRIGVIDDWAFSLSTVFEGVESLVLGHNPLEVEE